MSSSKHRSTPIEPGFISPELPDSEPAGPALLFGTGLSGENIRYHPDVDGNILVSGPAGTGKTRLLSHLRLRAMKVMRVARLETPVSTARFGRSAGSVAELGFCLAAASGTLDELSATAHDLLDTGNRSPALLVFDDADEFLRDERDGSGLPAVIHERISSRNRQRASIRDSLSELLWLGPETGLTTVIATTNLDLRDFPPIHRAIQHNSSRMLLGDATHSVRQKFLRDSAAIAGTGFARGSLLGTEGIFEPLNRDSTHFLLNP